MSCPGGCCAVNVTAAGGFDSARVTNYVFGNNAAGATELFRWLLDPDFSYGLFAIVTFSTRQAVNTPGAIQFVFNGAARRTAAGVTIPVTGTGNTSSSYPSFGFAWTSPALNAMALRFHVAGSPTANATIAYRWTREVPP